MQKSIEGSELGVDEAREFGRKSALAELQRRPYPLLLTDEFLDSPTEIAHAMGWNSVVVGEENLARVAAHRRARDLASASAVGS